MELRVHAHTVIFCEPSHAVSIYCFHIQYSIFECTVCRVHTRAKLPHAALSNCN